MDTSNNSIVSINDADSTELFGYLLRRYLEEEETTLPENYTDNYTFPPSTELDNSDDSFSSSVRFSFWNFSLAVGRKGDFNATLVKPQDVSVANVITSIYFNTAVFVALMIFYECLRRTIPSVYSSRKRMHHMQPLDRNDSNIDLKKDCSADSFDEQNKDSLENGVRPSLSAPLRSSLTEMSDTYKSCTRLKDDQLLQLKSSSVLPDSRPLDWIQPVLGVPWSKVLHSAGLDGYFFLRYIRMCVRITYVSTFWFFLILVPIYATGSSGADSQPGWYHLSTANIPKTGWRMWVACLFCYLFSFFIFFVVKQEYRHFLEVRQDFLAKGTAHVHPQHHYSLLVESIPCELRSDRALAEYFDKLFPGKVHSASVVLKLPDLEKTSARCLRSCRRLEKSIALLHATGKRPTHCVGRGRVNLLGIELLPIDCSFEGFCTERDDDTDDEYEEDDDVDDHRGTAKAQSGHHRERPRKGSRVDSISYYTQELAMHSRALFRMQQRKVEIAESGNLSTRADGWLDSVAREVSLIANKILEESAVDNDLLTSSERFLDSDMAEHMTSRYGSIGTHNDLSSRRLKQAASENSENQDSQGRRGARDVRIETFSSTESNKRKSAVEEYFLMDEMGERKFDTPFASDQYTNAFRRVLGRLGLDFLISIIKFLHGQLDFAMEGVISETMSSTGMVTFTDLTTAACASSAPLTVKTSVLDVAVAPEPRDIIWENAHVSRQTQIQREYISNFVLFLGVALWSIPLAAIQAFAKVDVIAELPGMEWILTYNGGDFSRFVNGYLPVVALLALIMILPVIFEYVAVKYEHRKTISDVQASMLGRYFYYQLVNIYVTVSAGSMLTTISDIVDRPSSILRLLGENLPNMSGYFVALLVTKILAGLPMIFLRFGALPRMLFLKLLANEKKLTQREVDAVYRLENVQYGWEFPTQLLVVVIVFTYAIMCPVILPVGLIYFMGALTVYKKQILYVYSPVYESGGAMFPLAVQMTLFGLVCGQLTFLGYLITRGCYHQPVFLFPLPVITVATSNYFKKTYADPSKRLSLERARAFDRLSGDDGSEAKKEKFDKNFYRQPVLTEVFREPWTYRRGCRDRETIHVREELRRTNRFITQSQLQNVIGAVKAFGSQSPLSTVTRKIFSREPNQVRGTPGDVATSSPAGENLALDRNSTADNTIIGKSSYD